MTRGVTRRHFLKTGAAAGGGLAIGIWWSGCSDHAESRPGSSVRPPGSRAWREPSEPRPRLHAYVAVGSDGRIVIRAPCPEIGQGVRTSLPMIVAEELAANWDDVLVEQAPADGNGSPYGSMSVGGSDSIADYWMPLREAGATARILLCAAAADRWGVPAEACEAVESMVRGPGGRSLPFGELAVRAAELAEAGGTPAESPPLRPPEQYRLVGTNPVRGDVQAISDGSAIYGLDVRIGDMRFAVLVRPPVPGARVRRFDSSAALSVDGVERVLEIEPAAPRGLLYAAATGGVAVIARNTWAAIRGAEALAVTWDRDTGEADSKAWREAALEALDRPTVRWLRNEGDVEGVLAAGEAVGATYELPLLAHGCMEPVNFTADAGSEQCRLWGPTQTPLNLQVLAAEALGLPREAVAVYPTLAGGGFGRRLAFDYGIEAALVSRTAGVPVQVVWPREQDVRYDYYRPPSVHRLRGTLDDRGRVTAWEHRLATVSLHRNIRGPEADPPELYDVQGGADQPYVIPSMRFSWTDVPLDLQLGSWRSVSHSFNVFAVESFLDELAVAGGRDPLDLRLELLSESEGAVREIRLPLPGRRGSPAPDRDLLGGVLRAVASESGWSGGRAAVDSPPDTGVRRGRGIACCYYKQSYAAHVAEVAVTADGRVQVERVFTALDCGRVVHPDGVRAQIEGAALDGVATVALWGISVDAGRIRQSNFHDSPLLRQAEAPEVVARVVESSREPSGAGEPPYPAVPPAITNAIFDATGVRVRRLPVDPGRLAI